MACGGGGGLPSYVHAVVSSHGGGPFSGPFDNDTRALQLPEGTARTLANGIYTVASGSAPSNVRVDVQLNAADEGRRNFTMSLYLCDWDAPGTPTAGSFLQQARSDGLLVFDLATRRKVIPVVKVDDYASGIWLRITYSRSMRLRFLNVLGDGPTLSAIMFD